MHAATTARAGLDAEPASWDPGCTTGNEEEQEASAAVVHPVGVTNLSRTADASFKPRERGGAGGDWAGWSGRSCFCTSMLTFIYYPTGAG